MKTTNMKRIMACLLAALTVTAVSSTTAFAASTTQNSSGSTVTDVDAEDPTGKDHTHGVETRYSDEITADSTEEVQVYATQASTFSVKIPKVIILDGQAGTAKYQVSVKGNISGKDMIEVCPTASFKMTSEGKADITATTTQTDQRFANTTLEDTGHSCVLGVNPDAFITTEGDVSVAGMTAGFWGGITNFNISLTENALGE